jgi:Mce-associated membrane protein
MTDDQPQAVSDEHVGAMAEPAPEEQAPPRRAGRARLPWALAALMTAVAVVFALMWAPLYSRAQEREEVREAAEQLVLHLTTFKGETIDEWVEITQRLATDEYDAEVAALFDAELRAALRDAQARSVGRLVNLFVQDIDADAATVFAVMRQTITNAVARQPVEDELRMQIELREVDGQWLVARVEILGPQPGPAPAAPALPEPAEDEVLEEAE